MAFTFEVVMLTNTKKKPCLEDTDPMPFGKYKGRHMQDVPANYLAWLKNENCSNELVANYIHNSWEAIQMELNSHE